MGLDVRRNRISDKSRVQVESISSSRHTHLRWGGESRALGRSSTFPFTAAGHHSKWDGFPWAQRLKGLWHWRSTETPPQQKGSYTGDEKSIPDPSLRGEPVDGQGSGMGVASTGGFSGASGQAQNGCGALLFPLFHPPDPSCGAAWDLNGNTPKPTRFSFSNRASLT